MLHSSKLASSQTISLIIAFIIALVVLVIFTHQSIQAGEKGNVISSLGPAEDALCKARSVSMIRDPSIDDIDGDGRHDYLCDQCVCRIGCHNDNDDKDGDKLPYKCDADDNDKLNINFNNATCPPEKIKEIGATKLKQCRPE